MRRTSMLDKRFQKFNLKKQFEALKKIKQDAEKDFKEQIEKLKVELVFLKAKILNQKFESDSLLVKYKNTIKSIADQCKKNGVKLSLNMDKIK